MVIQKTPTKIDKIASLRIGQRGENLATDIKMDVSDWIAVHPDANYYCLFKRPDEVQVQPVLSSLEEDVLTWTVRAWECAVIGVGYLEVRAVNPDTGLVAKSRVIPCAIEDSVIDDEGPVPPEMSWVGEVLAAKDTAVAAKTAAEEARDTAQTTVNGAIAGIQAEGQTQVGVVQAEGTTQVGAVQSEGTTQVGAVQAKGTEVLNSIPSDYSTLSGEVTDLKSAIGDLDDLTTTDKDSVVDAINEVKNSLGALDSATVKSVNSTTPDNNGNVNIDVSEYVPNAVDSWLDDHPEATTTVQDESLTYSKLVKGTLGYVIPQQFGAKGDGETDDSDALNACFHYAMENNCAVYLPMGVYITTSTGLTIFKIADGQSLIIIGDGQNSIIKRKDNSLAGSWSQLFTIEISPVNAHSNDVIFSNFCIDSNRRGQGEIPSDSYAYEASMDISVRNGSGLTEDSQYLDRFIVENMRFYDPVADCVNVSGFGQIRIRDVFIDKIVATDRQGTRNDIGFTASPLHSVKITNCDTGSIHFEFNGTVEDDRIIQFLIEGCTFGVCTLGGRFDLLMNNNNITDVFLISGFRNAWINNSTLPANGTQYNIMSQNGTVIIDGCTITTIVNPNDNNRNVYMFYIRTIKRVDIVNSEFKFLGELTEDFDSDSINDHVNGFPLLIELAINSPITIDSCRFDNCFKYAIRNQNNYIILKNLEIGTYIAILANSNAVADGTIEFINVRITNSCKNFVECGSLPSTKADLYLNGFIDTTENNFVPTGSITYIKSWMNKTKGNFRRIVHLSEPLDYSKARAVAGFGTYKRAFFLFKGDTFVYDGDDRQKYPEKWVIKNTEATIYSNSDVLTEGTELKDRLISYGSGYGATADRPSCYLSPGFEYFDTDLGKKIVWNGTTWVNCDGTALA